MNFWLASPGDITWEKAETWMHRRNNNMIRDVGMLEVFVRQMYYILNKFVIFN